MTRHLLLFPLAVFAASACSAPAPPPAPPPAAPDAAVAPPPPIAVKDPLPPKRAPTLPPGAIAWSDDDAAVQPAVAKSRALGTISDFQGFSADEQEFAYATFAPGAGFGIVHVVATATSAPVTELRLESPAAEQQARSYLAGKGYVRLAEPGTVLHGGKVVEATAKGLEVTATLGGQPLWTGNPFGGPVPTSKSATVRVAGRSPTGAVAVVRAEVDAGHEFGRAVGVRLVKLP